MTHQKFFWQCYMLFIIIYNFLATRYMIEWVKLIDPICCKISEASMYQIMSCVILKRLSKKCKLNPMFVSIYATYHANNLMLQTNATSRTTSIYKPITFLMSPHFFFLLLALSFTHSHTHSINTQKLWRESFWEGAQTSGREKRVKSHPLLPVRIAAIGLYRILCMKGVSSRVMSQRVTWLSMLVRITRGLW